MPCITWQNQFGESWEPRGVQAGAEEHSAVHTPGWAASTGGLPKAASSFPVPVTICLQQSHALSSSTVVCFSCMTVWELCYFFPSNDGYFQSLSYLCAVGDRATSRTVRENYLKRHPSTSKSWLLAHGTLLPPLWEDFVFKLVLL